MPLGTEVGLGPGDIVLDEYPAPPRKGAQQPPYTFWPDTFQRLRFVLRFWRYIN